MDEELLKGKTLLVVDDEVDLRDIVSSELEFMGARVLQAENISNGQTILDAESVDLIVSDIRMPGGTGVDLLKKVKAKNVNLPMILITGFADISVEDAYDKGAEGLMHKPFKLDDLIRTVEKFTRPLEQRFLPEDETPSKTLKGEASKFSIGRGGICVQINNGGSRVEINEPLQFELKVKDVQLSGTAYPRWLKHMDGMNWIEVGLEFISLDGPTLDFFLREWQSKTTVAYIPKI